MVTPIGDYIFPISPLPNIAPFTYKDGATYLSELERLRKFVNDDLVTYINTTFGTFADTFTTEINTLIGEVDTALANQNTENAANLVAVNAAIAAMNAAIATAETTIAASEAAAASSATAAANSATAAAASNTSAAGHATDAAASAALGYIHDIFAGTNVSINKTDPNNPIISATGSGGGGGGDTVTAGDHIAIDSESSPGFAIISAMGFVESLTAGSGISIDNTDPASPIITATDGGGGGGTVDSIVAGTNAVIDSTDPANPIISIAGGSVPFVLGSVSSLPSGSHQHAIISADSSMYYWDDGNIGHRIVDDRLAAGTGISITYDGIGNPTISASGGGGGGIASVVGSQNVFIDSTDPANPIIKVAGSNHPLYLGNVVGLPGGSTQYSLLTATDGNLYFCDGGNVWHRVLYDTRLVAGAGISVVDNGTISTVINALAPNDAANSYNNDTGGSKRYGIHHNYGGGDFGDILISDNGAIVRDSIASHLVQLLAFNGLISMLNGEASNPNTGGLSVGSTLAYVSNLPFSLAYFQSGSEPATSPGGMVYDDAANVIRYYDGTTWKTVATV